MELSGEPEKVVDFGGGFLSLERHGEYIEVRGADERIMVRFQNFDGIEIVDGPPVTEQRRKAAEWSERNRGK